MWLKPSFSVPFQLRLCVPLPKQLLLQLPPVGAAANAGAPAMMAPAAVASSMPPVTHVFLSTMVSLLSKWRDALTGRRSGVIEGALYASIPRRYRGYAGSG